jgi:hypothetical protein
MKNIEWVCEIFDMKWHQLFSTLLEKLTIWGQYSGSWEGKQAVFRSAGGNERWLNDESMHWGQWCSKKDNQWMSTFRSYWGQCCSKIVHDLVNPINNRESKDTLEGNLYIVIFWNMAIDRCGHTVAFERIWKRCAHHQDWRWIKAALKGQSHIVIFWNMVINRCYCIVALEWMSERCTPPRLTVGPSILELKCALHRMNMGDNMNIIDDVKTFLSTIWFDKLREIHEKEHWAYNDESFTASYEMHVWIIG